MPFQKEYLNLGGGMNMGSGVFTVPKAGIYAFSFKGLGNAYSSSYAGHGAVDLQRNGAIVAGGYSIISGASSNTFSTIYVQATLKLNKGDTIVIRHSGGVIHSSSDMHVQFVGTLIEEDLVIS